jgi:hypothetical protein
MDGVRRYRIAVAAVIAALVLVRLIAAAFVPLAFDEALYWRWSKHLAGGYLDHPPLNPILIRIGTTLFGDSEFGVRAMAVLLGLPATWAVWRAAAILFRDERVGATAALLFNMTLAMAAGSMLATPDSAVVVTSSFLLLTLAKVAETGRGAWWLAVGVAFGLGMFAKYSTIFFAPGILIWVLLVPELRKWLFSPWSWAGAAVSLAIFSPVLIWNAQHGWASVLYQAKRLIVHEWSLRYLGEFLATQAGLATPPVFVLACMGLVALLRKGSEPFAARVLIGAMVWPIALYFAWHSLHGRVEGNWPEPMYPALVVAAAVAADRVPWRGVAAWTARWSKRLAVPVGATLAAALYAQAIFGIFPTPRSDPTVRVLGAGWRDLGMRIDEVRRRIGAPVVLTPNYGLNGWLSFYLPSRPAVEQLGGRMRWVNEPRPDPELFRGRMLFVCQGGCVEERGLAGDFNVVKRIAALDRTRGSQVIDRYTLFELAEPLRPVLDKP